MTGDTFKSLHQTREQSREAMREVVIEKFYQSKPDLKEQYLSKAQDVSLQVGRDDSA